MDLVVRDSEANILDPGRSSAVTLYREHKLSSDNRSRHPAAFSSRSNSYMLLLSVKNFTWKRSEDMELFISVYTTGGRDGSTEPRSHNNDLAIFAILSVTRAPKPLCENYIIKWTRQGMARDIDQLNNFKVGKVLLSVNIYLRTLLGLS